MHNSLLISYLNYKTNSIFPQMQMKEPTGQQKLGSTVKKNQRHKRHRNFAEISNITKRLLNFLKLAMKLELFKSNETRKMTNFHNLKIE